MPKTLNHITYYLTIIIHVAILFIGCKKEKIKPEGYGIFSPLNATTVIMNGEIDTKTPHYWDNYIAKYPNTNKIIMKNCPGSSNDEANLTAARKVKKQNVSIHLPANAVIASGAVDFFLAGTERSREEGSKIGVHAWSDGKKEASDFPRGHKFHQPYIKYYIDMGFPQKDANDFYFFTINAASSSSIHWMTNREIKQYKLITNN